MYLPVSIRSNFVYMAFWVWFWSQKSFCSFFFLSKFPSHVLRQFLLISTLGFDSPNFLLSLSFFYFSLKLWNTQNSRKVRTSSKFSFFHLELIWNIFICIFQCIWAHLHINLTSFQKQEWKIWYLNIKAVTKFNSHLKLTPSQ